MRTDIEDFRTGWFGVTLGVKPSEIDLLIQSLQSLKETRSHFHGRSSFEGTSGIADLEFYLLPDEEKDNMTLDALRPIYPSQSPKE